MHREMMANDGHIAKDTLFEPERQKARAIDWDQSDRGLSLRGPSVHQGAQPPCCNPDAVYMAAAEIMPASTDTPLPRGSHPYTVQANRRGMLPELLDQIPPEQEIATVTADGAFDTRKCHWFERSPECVWIAARWLRALMKVRGHFGPTQWHALAGAPVRKGCPRRFIRHLPSSHEALAFSVGCSPRLCQAVCAALYSVLFFISA